MAVEGTVTCMIAKGARNPCLGQLSPLPRRCLRGIYPQGTVAKGKQSKVAALVSQTPAQVFWETGPGRVDCGLDLQEPFLAIKSLVLKFKIFSTPNNM